jgi:hypothetical protein
MQHEDNPNGLKYQIRKLDDLNWQVFEWQEGYVGQLTQSKWKPMESYHPDVDGAVKALLKYATLANLESGVGLDTDAILAALEQAREDVIAAAQAITPEEFKKKSARGRKMKS